MAPVFIRPIRLAILAAVVALTGMAAVAAEPHRFGCRNCASFCWSDYGYRPTTWRPWPTVCETAIEIPSKSAPKAEAELTPGSSDSLTTSYSKASSADRDRDARSHFHFVGSFDT